MSADGTMTNSALMCAMTFPSLNLNKDHIMALNHSVEYGFFC
ncbi:hypothetical protein PCIT_a3279 [Pseudoalteromonas citrea]|uniref:Uncharacterized protein n=1 Tax=Pseudoalteromonas citrea TaxID=43655 RepID=A0AAD4FR33_9GAMM|nr:hypothetical protein PCIT_a3279 [Pseudoalteromonas citrea]